MFLVAHLFDNADGGSTVLALISLAAMVLPLVALGFLARYFLKAGREDDATDTPVRPSPGP